MDRKAFFNAIRPDFGGSLSPPQVAGIEALLDEAELQGITDAHHMANILAQVRRETGSYMAPIKETVFAHHKNKTPTDRTVKRRLTKAWKAGKLRGVRSDYWSGGYFGRGQIQLTHRSNYEKIGRRLGVDLVKMPSRALDMGVSAKIAVTGMRDGLFRGHKLSDFTFPEDLSALPHANPRRIVNGVDGSDAEVARFHHAFHRALTAAGFGKRSPQRVPRIPRPPAQSLWAGLLAFLRRLFGG